MQDDELFDWIRLRISDVHPDAPVAFSPAHWRRQLESDLHDTIEELADQSTTSFRGWPTVTRKTVRAYTAGSLGAPDSVERGFVVTMIWGGGPPAEDGDPRQPWRTAKALDTPGAVSRLEQSAEAVREGQLGEGLRLATSLDRIGTSFATKWLWAVSSPQQRVAALVMDAQVAKTLRGFGRSELTVTQSTPSSRDRQRYVAYCETATRWAIELGVVPELVERALFSAATNR